MTKTKFCLVLLCGTPLACAGAVGSGEEGGPSSSNGLQPPAPIGASGVVPTPTGMGMTMGPGGSTVAPPAQSMNPNGGTPSGTDYQGSPLYTRFNRLSNAQWANSVKDLLKLASAPDVSGLPQPVTLLTDFTNNENVLAYDDANWLPAVYRLAESTIKGVSTDAAIAKIYTGTDSAGFLKAAGRRAFRRPLTATEITKYQAVYDAGTKLTGTGSAFTKGASLVLEAMIQSPHFVNRVEAGAANKPLDGYEIAAKLSLWLQNTSPDDALLDRAAKLTTADAIAAEAKTMLEKPIAADVMRKFYVEWLDFARLGDIQKDAKLNIPMDIGDELTEISVKYFDRVFSQNLGLKEILTGTQGYVGPKTAALYGVTATSVALTDFGSARTGYFAQVPYQLLYGTYGGQSDAIHRGANFQHKVLCGVLPPPLVVPVLSDAAPGQTKREVVAKSTDVPGCKECHAQYINPLGFPFENFDGVGRIRTMDNGAPVDTRATYPFPGNTATVADHVELMKAAYGNEMVHICYAKRLASYGLGRDIIRDDETWLRRVAQISQGGGSMKDVILALVKEPAFTNRAAGTP